MPKEDKNSNCPEGLESTVEEERDIKTRRADINRGINSAVWLGIVPAPGRLRQEDREFQPCLGYMKSSRLACATKIALSEEN